MHTYYTKMNPSTRKPELSASSVEGIVKDSEVLA